MHKTIVPDHNGARPLFQSATRPCTMSMVLVVKSEHDATIQSIYMSRLQISTIIMANDIHMYHMCKMWCEPTPLECSCGCAWTMHSLIPLATRSPLGRDDSNEQGEASRFTISVGVFVTSATIKSLVSCSDTSDVTISVGVFVTSATIKSLVSCSDTSDGAM